MSNSDYYLFELEHFIKIQKYSILNNKSLFQLQLLSQASGLLDRLLAY